MENLTTLGLKDLTINEVKNTNGGAIFAAIGVGLGIYSGVVALSVGAGYLYGKVFD